jgi:hypothetical protein
MDMQRLVIFLTGVFVAALPVTSTQAEKITLLLEGEIFCASNLAHPPPLTGFTCSPDLDVVHSSIGPGSPFEVTVTLPIGNPLDGFQGVFPNQTGYSVPLTGEIPEIGISGLVGGVPPSVEEFTFSTEELDPPFGPLPGQLPDAPLLVLVANDEPFFDEDLSHDQWSVFGMGSSTAIGAFPRTPVPNQFCDVFFSSLEELGNLDSEVYFVPDSLDGPVAEWVVFLRCTIFDPDQFPPFQDILLGEVNLLTVVGGPPQPQMVDIDLKPGSDPNCINPNAGGRTSVAILSSENFDAQSVKTTTLEFGGAFAERCGLEDTEPMDGILDLACRYRVSEVAFPAPGSDCGEVGLTGALMDGTAIEGSDVACLRGEATCETRPTR